MAGDYVLPPRDDTRTEMPRTLKVTRGRTEIGLDSLKQLTPGDLFIVNTERALLFVGNEEDDTLAFVTGDKNEVRCHKVPINETSIERDGVGTLKNLGAYVTNTFLPGTDFYRIYRSMLMEEN